MVIFAAFRLLPAFAEKILQDRRALFKQNPGCDVALVIEAGHL
ncbi:MAG TPA: hypothetical protein VH254_06030 [Candidatus Udaeobacter sp.]|jgi:hypothetical protein|nr:hypothetical protein [Candidatus Udaeobacter sp.]